MGLVHALVAEVLGELVDAGEASDDQSLEVELVGDTQVQGDVQGIVMGDEGPGVGASGNGLEDWSLYLHVAEGVEVLSHGLHDTCPLDEDILYLGIDHQVHIPHAVAELGIRKCIVNLALLLLDYREHSQ